MHACIWMCMHACIHACREIVPEGRHRSFRKHPQASARGGLHLHSGRLCFQYESVYTRSILACLSESFISPGSFLPLVRFSPLCFAAVYSVLACDVLLVGASVADAAVPAADRVFSSTLVRSRSRPLSLPLSSRVAGRCTPLLLPLWGC
jgi:hypothetical protein